MQSGAYRLELMHQLHPDGRRQLLGNVSTPWYKSYSTPRLTPDQDYPWRRLKLRVTPSDCRVTWVSGTDTFEIPSDQLHEAWMDQHRTSLPRSVFAPENGAGLYFEDTVVSFRSVVVRPIRAK